MFHNNMYADDGPQFVKSFQIDHFICSVRRDNVVDTITSLALKEYDIS